MSHILRTKFCKITLNVPVIKESKEGRKKGREEGREEGRAAGRKEGRKGERKGGREGVRKKGWEGEREGGRDSGTQAHAGSIRQSWVYFLLLRWKSRLKATTVIRQRRMYVVLIWKWRDLVPKTHRVLLQDRPSYWPFFSMESPNYHKSHVYNKIHNTSISSIKRNTITDFLQLFPHSL